MKKKGREGGREGEGWAGRSIKAILSQRLPPNRARKSVHQGTCRATQAIVKKSTRAQLFEQKNTGTQLFRAKHTGTQLFRAKKTGTQLFRGKTYWSTAI